ncbi:MAG: hypothetical protein QG644_343 [Patescibacteria group bacterium]|nr:hypothetical protein [Patescibacteria group bacterium]
MKDKVIYSICFGFILGVLVSSFVYINLYTNIFIATLSGVAILLFYFIYKLKWGVIFAVIFLTLSLGIFRFNLALDEESLIFDNRIGDYLSINGIVIDSPSVGDKNQKLNISVEEGGLSTEILITTNLNEEYKYGDELYIRGSIEKPENFLTEQGKVFDYVNYLRKDGIHYVIRFPEIEVLSSGNGNPIKRGLFSIKDKFLEKLDRSIASPENLLMGGLILGEKSQFDEKTREDFIRTGTIHIVALSGYNVTIVAWWFMKVFSFLPFTLSIGAGILAIILFVIMSGGASTALRAGIMAVLILLARKISRTYDVSRALIVTAVIMLLFNPFILVFDVSFQLSFIATIAVIYLTPKVEKYFKWVTPRFGLRDIVSVTFSAYIFVLPFILYKMGNLSIVALPANILILPFIPLTMALGFITGVLGLVVYELSVPFGLLSYVLLHYELGVISIFSGLPFASFAISNFPLSLTILIYAFFGYKLFGRNLALFFKGV